MIDGLPEVIDSGRPHSRRLMRWASMLIVLIVVSGAIAGWFRASDATETPIAQQPLPSDTSARAPAGTRIRIRVVNTTTTRGLAKRATSVLRDFGYDVVEFDTELKSKRVNTVVLSHTGHDAWAQRLRKALGVGAIEVSRDTSHVVDFTVLVGRDWKPPTQPFRP